MYPFLSSGKNVEGLICTRYIEMLSKAVNMAATLSISKYNLVSLNFVTPNNALSYAIIQGGARNVIPFYHPIKVVTS